MFVLEAIPIMFRETYSMVVLSNEGFHVGRLAYVRWYHYAWAIRPLENLDVVSFEIS